MRNGLKMPSLVKGLLDCNFFWYFANTRWQTEVFRR